MITTGGPFGALSAFGLNPYWAPGFFPDTIAEAINSTPYGDINTEISAPVSQTIDNPPAYSVAYSAAYAAATLPTWLGGGGCSSSNTACRTNFALNAVRNISPTITLNATATVPVNLENLRIPVVIAFGMGALSAGSAYSQLVADLPNQPGGTAEGAEAGSSLTILPMILLRNPGRANGGIAARFAPFFDLIGLNTVTPDGQVAQDGGAVLVPIKLDATVEYDPVSDFPVWPNAFSLANSLAAFAFPTYILRGTELNLDDLEAALGPVLDPVLNAVLGNVLSAAIGGRRHRRRRFRKPDAADQPEPRHPARPRRRSAARRHRDPRGGGVHGAQPVSDVPVQRFADPRTVPAAGRFPQPRDRTELQQPVRRRARARAADPDKPRYTDVDQENGYVRTLTDGGTGGADTGGVPFGTLPTNIDWSRVPADVLSALVTGIQQEFFNGGIPPGVNAPSDPQANPIAALLRLLGVPSAPQPAPELQSEPESESNLLAANSLPSTDSGESITVSTPDPQPQEPVAKRTASTTTPQPVAEPTEPAAEATTPTTPKKRPVLNKVTEPITSVQSPEEDNEDATGSADTNPTARESRGPGRRRARRRRQRRQRLERVRRRGGLSRSIKQPPAPQVSGGLFGCSAEVDLVPGRIAPPPVVVMCTWS